MYYQVPVFCITVFLCYLDRVTVDDRPVLLEVLGGEAALVDDLHLLDDGALARLSRTWTTTR